LLDVAKCKLNFIKKSISVGNLRHNMAKAIIRYISKLTTSHYRDTVTAQLMVSSFTAGYHPASKVSENLSLTGGKVLLLAGRREQIEMMHHQAGHMHTVD